MPYLSLIGQLLIFEERYEKKSLKSHISNSMISPGNFVCILYASNATWSMQSAFVFDNFGKTDFPIEEMYGNCVPLRCPIAATFNPRAEIFRPWLRLYRSCLHAKS